jgi:hypothetical protein
MLVLPIKELPAFALINEKGVMVSQDGKPAQAYPAGPWLQAFTDAHTTDAHFTCYHARHRNTHAPSASAPRMAKIALALLTSQLAPADLQLVEIYGHTLALDIDLPGHGRWTDETRASYGALFQGFADKGSILAYPTLFYTTGGGMRLVWALDEAVPVEGKRGLEDLLSGLVAEAHIMGLAADPMCRDWTRLFRLPKVRRADKSPSECQTVVQDYFRLSWGKVSFELLPGGAPPPAQPRIYPLTAFKGLSEYAPEQFQSPLARRLMDKWGAKIGQEPARSSALAEMVRVGEVPDAAEVQRLRYLGGTSKETALAVRTKRMLEAYAAPRSKLAKPLPSAVHALAVLWEGQSLFPGVESGEQGLHEGIGKLARSICYCLRSELGEGEGQLTPQFLYTLVLNAATRANESRTSGRRPESELSLETWRYVTHTYRQYVFQVREGERQKEDDDRDSQLAAENNLALEQDRINKIKATLKSWIRLDPAKAQGEVRLYDSWIDTNWEQLLIIDTGASGISVLNFDAMGNVAYSQPAMKVGGIYAAVRDCGHTFINILKPSSNPAEVVYKSEGQIMHQYGFTSLEVRLSRLIEAHQVELVPYRGGLAPVFTRQLPGMRKDITPKYDPLVERWLQCIGGPMTNKLLDWLACYTRIDETITGLYIQGDPSIGKGMLGLALTNMTFSRANAKLESALDQFQDTMMRTPFVWGDEDGSLPSRTQRSMMNTYKKLITGEFDTLNPKGTAAQPVAGKWRVYISANTANYLEMGEEANKTDLEAVVVRCLHINADNESARMFLESLGGHGAKPGEGTFGWPEHNIPCHIAWLAQNRVVVRGQRFLVEGVKTDYHEGLTSGSGVSDALMRGLGKMLKTPGQYGNVIHIRKGELFVFAEELLNQLLAFHEHDRFSPRFNTRSIATALQHLCTDKKRTSVWTRLHNQEAKAHHAWRIDLQSFIHRLYLAGGDCDFRDALTNERWRELAPPDAIALVDTPPPPEFQRKIAPPLPTATHLTNGHNGHVNGSSNGHHPAPAFVPSSVPFTGPPPMPPGMN